MTLSTDTTSTGDVLRADSWDAYVGQAQLKARLQARIDAAVADNRMLGHILLGGPAGVGKTTLANLIAKRLGDDIRTAVAGPAFDQNTLVRILRDWDGGVLFIDEIHRLSKQQQEDLLTLTEDGYLQLKNGKRLYHDFITVIGATTEPEKVIEPLRDRFTFKPRFESYSDDEMGQIIVGMADRLGFEIDLDTAIELGLSTGGTPRNARQFVLAARDLMAIDRDPSIENILDLCAMDRDGLTDDHIAYLAALLELGGVAGVEKIASQTRMHASTIANIERLLVAKQFIAYGPSGREITQTGSRKARGEVVAGSANRERVAPPNRRNPQA